MSFATVAAVVGTAVSIRGAVRAGRDSSRNADEAAALADPFAEHRPRWASELNEQWSNLTNLDPSTIMKDPQFQFLREQGLGAINSSNAQRGTYNSGGRGVEAARFATGLSTTFLNNRWSQQQQILQSLLGLSGANTGNPGAASTNWGNFTAAGQQAQNTGWGNALGILGRLGTQLYGSNTPAPTTGQNYNGTLNPPANFWGS